MGCRRAVGYGLGLATGLLGMIVGHGEQKVPECAQAIERSGFGDPGVVHHNDLLERGVCSGIQVLRTEFIVDAVVNRIHPFHRILEIHGMLLVVIRERRSAVLTG
jgi:hypothetical protein